MVVHHAKKHDINDSRDHVKGDLDLTGHINATDVEISGTEIIDSSRNIADAEAGTHTIGTNGQTSFVGADVVVGAASPVATAIMQADSTTKGSLIPRMTTVQRGNIASPAEGLMVYDTDVHSLYVYNGTGWVTFGGQKTLCFNITHDTVYGRYNTYTANNAIDGNFDISIPGDFNSLVSCDLVLIPEATDATADIDIYSDYAAVGEGYQDNQESETTNTYSTTTDQMFALDLTPVMSGVAAGDCVGILLQPQDAGDDLYCLGIELVYV